MARPAVGGPVVPDIAEAPVAPFDQMAAGGVTCPAVRHADGDVDGGAVDFHHLDHTHAALIQHPPRRQRIVEAGDQDRLGLPGEDAAHKGFLVLHLVVADADHGLVAAAAQPGIDALQHLGKDDVGQGRHHHAQQMRDPNLVRVLQRQTAPPLGLAQIATIRRGVAARRLRWRGRELFFWQRTAEPLRLAHRRVSSRACRGGEAQDPRHAPRDTARTSMFPDDPFLSPRWHLDACVTLGVAQSMASLRKFAEESCQEIGLRPVRGRSRSRQRAVAPEREAGL